ncbi:hypothetical protein [Actinopolymorpha rutila]|uniref:Mycothiol maleylpyruvate isomerase N-terminal domain-containing protein n=1 Tax=Actinopolymorpha rutila TaxID=446787 RepID=A0A852ZD69_9ACTN|nr:hypothetical protein [Actinopolymorpha rutila]NYH91087.1 hypothetical protein [Actinopolymorpha rutila]
MKRGKGQRDGPSVSIRRVTVEATDHLDRAIGSAVAALQQGTIEDWQRTAGPLDWTCRFTADHTAHCMQLYALQLASMTQTHYVSFFSRALEDATPSDVLELLEVSGHLLSAVVRGAEPTDRGFHPFGAADAEGTAGMGCIELLVHTGDIATGLNLPFQPPADTCAWVLARMFPDRHAELEAADVTNVDPWSALRWATGRTPLPGLTPVGPTWKWHSSPLTDE